jgi:hypothetical protein
MAVQKTQRTITMTLRRASRRRTPAASPCPECGRSFARNDSLTRHLKTHLHHSEKRPFHRIIREKFRACSHCKRSKVRCTGRQPCARCEQLKQKCVYSQRESNQITTAVESSSTESPQAEPWQIKSSTISSAVNQQELGEINKAHIVPSFVASSPDTSQLFQHHSHGPSMSSAGSSGIMHQSRLLAEVKLPTSSLPGTEEFAVACSPYASPTFPILDPYSYKLPSIADSSRISSIAQPLANCRYPVLEYLAPFLDVDFSSSLACDLLDTYFSSAFSSRLHPTCHYVHNFILRRCDVLDGVQPRKTHPALIASMLFLGSLTDKALGLFSGPGERDRVCKYLSLITYQLLNPPKHDPLLTQEDLGLTPSIHSTPGWTNDDIREALSTRQGTDVVPISWANDYIIALLGVSSVISCSENKAASTRW